MSYPVLTIKGFLIKNFKPIDIQDPKSWFCLIMSTRSSDNSFFKTKGI